ncbi:hypothetical protein CASFOL_030499 [Castilleja foliolosa]|uniref:Remorin N-terminal domain-containing protein n=1 Tax=Castilleja foliolosa TaxID=1961234 RepID=A0ABD3CA21_9LAMI
MKISFKFELSNFFAIQEIVIEPVWLINLKGLVVTRRSHYLHQPAQLLSRRTSARSTLFSTDLRLQSSAFAALQVMAEEEAKKVEPYPDPSSESPPETVEPPKDAAEEKTVIPPPPSEEKADDCKALVVVVEKPVADDDKKLEGSINRDAVLARLATEKRLSLIKAWEENEKSKAENNILAGTSSRPRTFKKEIADVEEEEISDVESEEEVDDESEFWISSNNIVEAKQQLLEYKSTVLH